MLAATSCSDFNDYNTVAESWNPSADQSLWENISSNPGLSDFAQVLQAVGYDDVLSAPTTYTVWAPVNGTFNKDSVLALAQNASTKQKVIDEFVYDHIANYAHQESDAEDNEIYMLSKKLIAFDKNSGNITFDGKELYKNGSVFNTPSSNGLLYTMNGMVPFRPNGYEYIFVDKSANSISDSIFSSFIKKYETVKLDENASVKGEIVDGKQVYDDSVTVTSNSMIKNTLNSLLEDEDSSYTVLIPTDEAWNKAYEKIKSYYNYITPLQYQDLSSTSADFAGKKGGTCPTTTSGKATILAATAGVVASSAATLKAAPTDAEITDTKAYWTDSITKMWIVRNSVFSENNKKYNSKLTTGEAFVQLDSLYSTTHNKLTNLVNLDNVTIFKQQLSNGHARVISDYPFYSFETYAGEITTRTPGRVVTASGYNYESKTIARSKLDPNVCQLDDDQSSLKYVKATLPVGSNYAPEMDFYLPGVRSTTYDIYAVMVPACVEGDTLNRPYTLRFDLHYTDAKNTPQTGRFNGETIVPSTNIAVLSKVKAFTNDPTKVDTLYLGRFTFPVCYAGTEASPNIKVMSTLSSFSSSNRKKYDSELRIANIILKPMDLVEFEKATKED